MSRLSLFGLGSLLIAACYSPSFREKQPDGGVPSDASPIDAPADSPPVDPNLDSDGDGIKDVNDNCSAISNPNQANEDGDKFGDVCDPCPPVRNDTPSDPDGDGVADSCDPNPNVAGDRIELFEGFLGGGAAWARQSGWTATTAAGTGDVLRVDSVTNNDEVLLLPTNNNADRLTVSVGVTVEKINNQSNDHLFEIGLPYVNANNSGFVCGLVQQNNRFLGVWDDFTNQSAGTATLAWVDNTTYTIVMKRKATEFVCEAVTPGGVKTTINASRTLNPNNPVAALRAFALGARVSWVMLVRSP